MTKPLRLDDTLVAKAQATGQVEHRTAPKQVEHWAAIGQMAEDNPDLPYSFIREALLAKAEIDAGELTPYVRRKRT